MSSFCEKLRNWFIVFSALSPTVELSPALGKQLLNTLEFAWIVLSQRSEPKKNLIHVFNGETGFKERKYDAIRAIKSRKEGTLWTLG